MLVKRTKEAVGDWENLNGADWSVLKQDLQRSKWLDDVTVDRKKPPTPHRTSSAAASRVRI